LFLVARAVVSGNIKLCVHAFRPKFGLIYITKWLGWAYFTRKVHPTRPGVGGLPLTVRSGDPRGKKKGGVMVQIFEVCW
jgi:hypothetical protein